MNVMVKVPPVVPEGLKKYWGQITDMDSHEMIPAQSWVDMFGEFTRPLVRAWTENGTDVTNDISQPNVPGFKGDVADIDPDTVYKLKGSVAPGAVDPARREAVMDAMGVRRQLMFPTSLGMFGAMLSNKISESYGLMPTIKDNRRAYGLALIHAYNKWAMGIPKVSDRVRPVLPLVGDTPAELMQNLREMIDNGIKAVVFASAIPPGGKSPGHPDLDPLWAMLAENNIAATLHASVQDIYSSDEWHLTPQFEGFKIFAEIRVDPWHMVNQHVTAQNFLQTMVITGVFERHPTLRFGVAEVGIGWVAPMCKQMDRWCHVDICESKFGEKGVTFQLSKPPSYYVRRNVRISGFEFERVDEVIQEYDLEDVLCFASDYPHVEGGTNPIGKWYSQLEPLGPEVVEKFFVTNAQWLLPD